MSWQTVTFDAPSDVPDRPRKVPVSVRLVDGVPERLQAEEEIPADFTFKVDGKGYGVVAPRPISPNSRHDHRWIADVATEKTAAYLRKEKELTAKATADRAEADKQAALKRKEEAEVAARQAVNVEPEPASAEKRKAS